MKISDVLVTVNAMQADGVIENYAIGGAVGATFFVEPVSTVDVDIFVTFRLEPGRLLISLQPIFDYLTARGCALEGEYVMIAGWPVQFLPPTGPLLEEALSQAITMDVAGIPARVFTAEHLAAIALQTARGKDKARLLQFIEAGALDPVRMQVILDRHGLLEKWSNFMQEWVQGE